MICLLATPTESCFSAKNECYFHRSVYGLYHVCLINENSGNNPYKLKFVTAGGRRITKKNYLLGVFFPFI